MSDLEELRRLAEVATPGPWHRHTYGHRSIRAAAGKVTEALFRVDESVPGGADRELRDTFHDLSYVHADGGDGEGPSVALTGNGPKQVANSDFIAAANPATILSLLDRLAAAEGAAAALDVERLAKAILAVDYRMKRPLGWGFALGEAQKLAAAYAAAHASPEAGAVATTDEEGAER